MKNYLAAALAIGISTGPALALEAGVGASVGGVGANAGVSAGSQGASVGVGASADGVGGANVGASTGTGGTGVSAGANLGSASAGVSAGVSADPSAAASAGVSAGVSANPSAVVTASAASPDAVTTAAPSAKGAGKPIALPRALRPSKAGEGDLQRATKGYPVAPLSPLKAIPGTPAAVVRTCRAAIMTAARPLGAMRVYVASAGLLRRRGGGLNAPIEVRIDYARQGGIEIRQAKVGCRLDAAGRVTAVI
ncbi:MAG: hypothetical protein EOQ52_26115 [Mesorhizobium sp.]|uniref:hypothetical protein n=1 Tax=Mesorhizobium sp. TaxID=1871066 RepID=UPI000FE5219A|nr:hypothetical protein [Mesorhizobium sp.]RWB83683.1 MAG: hypothetical protein EOQ52_26115 [Mesorhizobium sp.]